MSTGQSWKWLAPRLNAEQLRDGVRAAAAAPSRPCLPTVEALDERTMFNGVTDNPGGVPEGPPITPEGVLIGMLKGQFVGDDALIKHQFDLLGELGAYAQKSIGNVKYNDVRLATNGLHKISDVLHKVVEDVLSAKSLNFTKIKFDLAQSVVKITDLASSIDDGSKESKFDQAVASVSRTADAIFKFVSSAGAVKLSPDYKHYVKLSDAFGDTLGGLLKLKEDVVFNKNTTGDTTYLKIKLTDILVSSLKLSDKQIKIEIEGLHKLSTELQGQLLAPPPVIETDGGFGGGVVESETDDIIK